MRAKLIERPHRSTRESFGFRTITRVWFPGVVVHLLLVVPHIGRNDFWYDEALSLAATKDLVATASHTGGNMIAYYVMLTPWSWVSVSPEWLRLPSFVATSMAVGVASTLVARQVGVVAGRLAGIFIACSYIAVRYASEARSYGLLALLVAVAWLALDKRLCGDGGRWTRIAYPVAVVLLPLVHGLAVCQVAMMLLALAWARPPARLLRSLALPCLASLGIGIALWATGGRDIADWISPLSVAHVSWFFRRLVAPYFVVAAALLGVAATGAWALLRNPASTAVDRFRQVAIVLWGPGAIALLLLLSTVRPYEMDRYAFPSAFGIAALLAVAVTRPRPRMLQVALAVSVLAMVSTGQVELQSTNDTWSRSADTIAADMRPGDRIAFSPRDVRLTFEAALVRPLAQQGPPLAQRGGPLGTFDRFPASTDPSNLPSRMVGARRLWILYDAGRGAPAPVLPKGFSVVRTWQYGSVTIRLLRPA